jgi:alkaline phosphatase D
MGHGGRGWTLDRRTFLSALAAGAVKIGVGGCGEPALGLERDPPPPAPPLPDGVFALGVASGDPLHDRVVIWTRLAPDPLNGGGLDPEAVPVIWEVFDDEALSRPVRNGWTWAVPALAHSVHVDVDRLEAGRPYWYRFRVGDTQASATGRTRTLPPPDASPSRLRLALACCQKYRDGFYTAHAHLAREALDAVVFLGDYIYESGSASDVPGRLPLDTERVTDLAGFRGRYGAYRLDADLQASHAAHPWIVIWDDHEVSNDYAGLTLSRPRRDDGDPVAIRRAAYQAWYEHMPVRLALPEDPLYLPIHRKFRFGDLATIFALDGRQYRDPPPCDGEMGPPCEEMLAGGRSMLGAEQREWLLTGLARSTAHWNLVAQPVLFSPVLFELGFANPDQWDGYVDERQTILDALARLDSPMVLSGDVHAAGFGELYHDQFDPTSERVALEVLTTSIASGGDGADEEAELAPLIEMLSGSVHYIDAERRGFAVCDWTRSACEVTYRAVTTVRAPEADLYTAARFEIEAGTLDHALLERAGG